MIESASVLEENCHPVYSCENGCGQVPKCFWPCIKMKCMDKWLSLTSHTLHAKKKGGRVWYNASFHSPCIDGEAYFVCTAYDTIVNMRLNSIVPGV